MLAAPVQLCPVLALVSKRPARSLFRPDADHVVTNRHGRRQVRRRPCRSGLSTLPTIRAAAVRSPHVSGSHQGKRPTVAALVGRDAHLVIGVAVACVAALGLTACESPFVPKPCPSTLYQPTATFADGQTDHQRLRRSRIHSQADVTTKRNQLLQFIWGPAGFPATKLPVSVDKNVTSPVAGREPRAGRHVAHRHGRRSGRARYHFIPLNRKANRLVVLHQGHGCTFDDGGGLNDEGYGMQRTINSLLSDGFSVLAVYMQHMNYVLPNDCGVPSHDEMFQTLHTEGSVMKFFLEPVAVSLNYLQTQSVAGQFPRYQDFSMIGLSGGGWTTVVYAAIDPRIKLSFPVAGSLPLYLRFPASEGDTEQNLSRVLFDRRISRPPRVGLGWAGPPAGADPEPARRLLLR